MNSRPIHAPAVSRKEIIFPEDTVPLLFLLEIDPCHIYAYWEISPKELSTIINKTGKFFHESQLILRIYEVNNLDYDTLELGSYFDIIVEVKCGGRWGG